MRQSLYHPISSQLKKANVTWFSSSCQKQFQPTVLLPSYSLNLHHHLLLFLLQGWWRRWVALHERRKAKGSLLLGIALCLTEILCVCCDTSHFSMVQSNFSCFSPTFVYCFYKKDVMIWEEDSLEMLFQMDFKTSITCTALTLTVWAVLYSTCLKEYAFPWQLTVVSLIAKGISHLSVPSNTGNLLTEILKGSKTQRHLYMHQKVKKKKSPC